MLLGTLLVVVCGAVAGTIVLAVQRLLPKQRRENEVEAIGFVFAVVGVLYAIVLAFVVIDVWNKMTLAGDVTYREAHALVEEYWYAQTLPEPQRAPIERLSREYATFVINKEWSSMRAYERPGLEGWGLVDQLRRAVETSTPAQADGAEYQHALEQVQVLAQAREARLAAATEGVPSVVWFVLIGGGLLIVAFTYIFDIAGVATQMVLAIGLTAMVVLLLWAVYQLEYPYGRQLRIDPTAFEFALARFGQISRGG